MEKLADVPTRSRGQRHSDPVPWPRLARGLGWFSIGLGLAEILAPRRLATVVGVDGHRHNRRTIFGLGLRELVNGAGILAQPRSAKWLWARVGGDTMDLALLASALGSRGVRRSQVAAAAAAVAGITVLDVLVSRKVNHRGNGAIRRAARVIEASSTITIDRPAEELYRFWRNFENLPQCMSHLESVHVIDDRKSHWVAKGPANRTIEWDAEITEDRPNELIAWRSIGSADVPNAGTVRFARAPGDRGTEVHVTLRYQIPGGSLGATVAKLFGQAPDQRVEGDLRRFKQVMETGEITHSDASIHRGPYPAQPSGEQRQPKQRSLRKDIR